ncbi:hypothetical protein [Scytonema sp. PCC 10023]|jgi:hypothetical protein|uniref:hypothetical protein n=1 Tax=Scytonema sp. PCC 10023 TaxID=1680591 RepID=UPI0039C73A63
MTNERRRGKSTVSAGQKNAEQGGQHLQSLLQQQSEQAGLMIADNFQAHSLMCAIKFMQSGQYGPKTAAVLDAFTTGTSSPLEEWGNQIQAWNQPALLSSASESTGSSTLD